MTASGTFWDRRSVFVTGCTGLLGSWLVQALTERGATVTGLIRDWVPGSRVVREHMLQGMNVVHGSVEDFSLVERALNEYEVDTVFHLAAQTIVGIANMNPMSTFESNIKGTWCVLEAGRRTPRVKRVVIASSDKAYGTHADLPYNEATPMRGEHPYDVSKSCADLIARSFWKTYGLPVCVTRCGNFFGGGDLNFNRLVPGTIRSALYSEHPVVRSDGTYIRDYIYVKDAVLAYLLVAERLEELGLSGEAFNFSNELQLTVLALVDRILALMDRRDLRAAVLNEAEGEIHHQYLSAAKARETLGWRPTYTLDDGLNETIAWYREYFHDSGRRG